MSGMWQRLAIAALVTAVASTAVAHVPRQRPPLPLEVEFSLPGEGDADVRLDTTIRVKFSRDANQASFVNRIRVGYSTEESAERGEAQPPPVPFTTTYSSSTLVLEIIPRQSLERFRQVRVELLQGIVGRDGSVLKPWSLRFRTGGS